MADRIFRILFPCFSVPDHCPPLGDSLSEDHPVSQRPSPSEGGDLPSEGQTVFHGPAASEGGELPTEAQTVFHGPAASEGGEDLASEDHILDGNPNNLVKYIKQRVERTGDLDGLIENLSQLFERIDEGKSLCQEPEEKPSSVWTWLNNSEGWNKLAEFLSALIDCASDLKEIIISRPVQNILEGIGKASFATAGLLAVEYILKTVQQISENNEDCLRLLKELFFLARTVKQFKDSEKGMQTSIKDATKLAFEGFRICCTQITSDNFSKAWLTSVNKDELRKIEQKIKFMYLRINAQMGVCLLDANERKKQPRLSRGYPDHAVGIEDSFREVTSLLEWGSKKNSVAVILYGFGGIGKTTLADAVFSRVGFAGCQYSMVELSDNMDSNKIVELQKNILKDLMGTKNIPEIRKHEEGRRLLSSKLEEVAALIYIDNVLDKDQLRQLLPLNFDRAKKVRLLITTRDLNVRKTCRMKTAPKEYRMRGISSAAAEEFLIEQLSEAAKKFLIEQMPEAAKKFLILEQMPEPANSLLERQMTAASKSLHESCGGIPLLLTLVAQELCSAKDTQEVRRVIEEIENMEGEEFGENIESCFVYKLPNECKDPFIDICSFFEGWKWDMVADIIGNHVLDKLERRGLVNKDTNGVVTVNDVILKIGRRKTHGMRSRFTTTSELQKEDEKVEQIRYLRYKPARCLNQCIKMPSNLKYMEIDGKFCDLEKFPVSLLRLPDLRILKLSNFDGLKELPSELGNLVKGLRQLTLSNCKSFNELPYSISKLKSLRVLKVDHCKSLNVLPQDLGNLTSLAELDLSYCVNLRQLPKDFGLLPHLQVLNLEHCESLEKLPDSFEGLSSLNVLNLSYCKGLESLPGCLEKLTSLVRLDLKGCKNLSSIPDNIGLLRSLPSMDISGCSSLKGLPDGFCNLPITSLKLTGCENLKELPDHFGMLKRLRVLKLKSCKLLQKLPDSFSKLEHLVHLDLSGCSVLEQLSKKFLGLSSLRTLSLKGLNLKKLDIDFQSLSSLQHLDLRDCEGLDAKWMDKLVGPESLDMVYITENVKGGQSRACTVDTGQGLSEEDQKKEWKNLSPKFAGLLKHGEGKPFPVSTRPLDTVILVMFDGHPDFNHDFPWPLIEEVLDDVEEKIEMIYIGKHFNKLPRKLAQRIMGRAVDNSDARLLFQKLFFTLSRNGAKLWYQYMDKFFAMTTKIAATDDNGKYLSCWELLSKGKDSGLDSAKLEEFLITKCRKYHALKQLTEETQKSNIHLLREMFVNVGEENCLLVKSHQLVSVDELKGKTIFIDIRLSPESHDHISFQSLSEVYKAVKDTHDIEIISILIGQLSTEFEKLSGHIPWLVVQNPCSISRAVKYFLIKEHGDSEILYSRFLSRVTKIEPEGKIAAYNPLLTMFERWGPEVYPFTNQRIEERIEELRNTEWIEQKSMCSLEFLFKPMKSELDEVKKVTHQGKMTWLLCNGKDPDTHRVRLQTFVSSVKRALKDVMEKINFIYVPHYDEKNKQMIPVTDSINMAYLRLEETRTPQGKKELGLEHSLNLSQCAAMRFWARVCDLRKEMEGKAENRMKTLLTSMNFGCLSMVLMDKDGNMVTCHGRKLIDAFDNSKGKSNNSPARLTKDKAKFLIQQLIKGSEEERKKAVDELES